MALISSDLIAVFRRFSDRLSAAVFVRIGAPVGRGLGLGAVVAVLHRLRHVRVAKGEGGGDVQGVYCSRKSERLHEIYTA